MKIGFIGCGNMGGALARAVSLTEGVEILLNDRDTDRAIALARELSATAATLDAVAACDYIFLGVKPDTVCGLLEELSAKISKSSVLISMAAGVATEKLTAAIGEIRPIIRIMPNTPVAYGKGMILYTATEAVSEDMISGFLGFMKHAGELDRIPEKLIDAGSAVSGCGPAFVYMFIEALADGGVASGLARDKAMQYAAQTVLGSAEVVLRSGKHPGALKDAVCSPGGSTIEGVLALESGGMRGVVSDAVIAAYEKTKKLGK